MSTRSPSSANPKTTSLKPGTAEKNSGDADSHFDLLTHHQVRPPLQICTWYTYFEARKVRKGKGKGNPLVGEPAPQGRDYTHTARPIGLRKALTRSATEQIDSLSRPLCLDEVLWGCWV